MLNTNLHRAVSTTRAAMRIFYLVKIFIADCSFDSLTLEFIRGKCCVHMYTTVNDSMCPRLSLKKLVNIKSFAVKRLSFVAISIEVYLGIFVHHE